MKGIISLLLGIVLFTSCTKDDICGTVTNYSEVYNEYLGEWEYYLYVDGDRRFVDYKTYMSYATGDGICLTY